MASLHLSIQSNTFLELQWCPHIYRKKKHGNLVGGKESRMNIIKKGLWQKKNLHTFSILKIVYGLTFQLCGKVLLPEKRSKEFKFSLRWSIAWDGSILYITWFCSDQINANCSKVPGTPRTFLILSHAQQQCIFYSYLNFCPIVSLIHLFETTMCLDHSNCPVLWSRPKCHMPELF